MTRVTKSILIRGAAEHVFDTVTTAKHWPEWHPATEGVSGDVDQPMRLGGKIRERARIGGRVGEGEWRVVAHERPRRVVLQLPATTFGDLEIAYDFEPQAGGVRFTRSLTFDLSRLPPQLDRAQIERQMDSDSEQALAKLKALVEAVGRHFRLDHLSIFTSFDAPEAATLEALGLQRLGGVTKHGNFGTASTSFFFANAYLELFWSYDAGQTARSVKAAGLDVEARMNWRQTGAAPFGVMLCPTDEGAALPFATTSLRADWMPGEVLLRFAGAESAEPYYAVIPQPLWYSSFRANLPAPQHPLGVKTLTEVHITVTTGVLSDKARLLNADKLLTITRGLEPLMTLTFDNGAQGKTIDVRPVLPLMLRC